MRPENELSSLPKNGSIAERMALLKNSGENNWKKRVAKKEGNDDLMRENVVSVSLHFLVHKFDNKKYYFFLLGCFICRYIATKRKRVS